MSSTAASTLNPELREYHKEYLGLKQEGSDLMSVLTEAQFNWSPGPGRWSIGECIGHINKSETGIIKSVDKLIEQAGSRQLKSDGPFSHGFFGNFFVKSMNPPYRFKVKTAFDLVPPKTQSVEPTAAEFQRLQDEMLERIQRASGLNLSAVREKVAGPLKLSLGQWIAFGASHGRRHLWQARQVKNNPAFPA
jgi:hypothetical protein